MAADLAKPARDGTIECFPISLTDLFGAMRATSPWERETAPDC